MSNLRTVAFLVVLGLVILVPIVAAAMSPLLAWRNPVYIIGGFGGVIAMCLMLLQPLLAAGFIPRLSPIRSRRLHRWVGSALVLALFVHLIGLWITSPPDVIDALLFVSATPFSVWGVIAMWSVIITAVLVTFRRTLKLSAIKWRVGHKCLGVITVVGSVVHALMIEGTMETSSKVVLCTCVVVATALALVRTNKR